MGSALPSDQRSVSFRFSQDQGNGCEVIIWQAKRHPPLRAERNVLRQDETKLGRVEIDRSILVLDVDAQERKSHHGSTSFVEPNARNSLAAHAPLLATDQRSLPSSATMSMALSFARSATTSSLVIRPAENVTWITIARRPSGATTIPTAPSMSAEPAPWARPA